MQTDFKHASMYYATSNFNLRLRILRRALLSFMSPSSFNILSRHTPNRPRISTPKLHLTLNSNSPTLWLALYFFFNLSLTLYNKSVLIHFPFPYTLTAIHAFCGSVGTWLLLRYQNGGWRALLGLPTEGKRRRKRSSSTSISTAKDEKRGDPEEWRPGPGVPRLNTRESIVLFFFSILYTINIVVSNASLRLVTVPFHQVVRAATPFFTLLFSAIILRDDFKSTRRKALSLVPVVAGVGFATYGDYYFTILGFLLTLLGTVLAALKTIITHLILIKPCASPQSSISSSSNSKSPQPTLPLHSPVGYSTVPLPAPSLVSEKENVYYRHKTSLIPALSPQPQTPPHIENENVNDSLLLSASNFPPSPYSPPSPPSAYSSSQSSYSLAPPTYSPPPSTLPRPSSTFQIPKLKLTPLHLLYLLSPLAFVQTTLLAHWTGELDRVGVYLASLGSSSAVPTAIDVSSAVEGAAGAAADAAIAAVGVGGYLTRLGEWSQLSGLGGFQFLSDLGRLSHVPDLRHMHVHMWSGWSWGGKGGVDPRVWLLLNGVMAFWLNVVSFNANRRVGALGMTVAANVKQVLTILLAVLIFDLTITPANALGILLTIFGGAVYAFVELREKKESSKLRRG